MKHYFRLLVIASLFLLIVGCSNSSDTTNESDNNDGDVEIVFQSHITPNLTAEVYDEVLKRFEDENPGIKVKRINAPDADSTNYVKTLLSTGDMPDVVHNIATYDFVEADALEPFPIDDDIKTIKDYDVQMIDGELYNLFPYVQPHSLVFYNKDLFEQAGITQEPETWDEFLAINKKLKENDTTPLLFAGDWTSGLIFSVLTSPDIYGKNPNWYADRNDEKVSFTDDTYVEQAEQFKELVDEGYFFEGALSIGQDQMQQIFLDGEAAMYSTGIWFTAAVAQGLADFEVGVFPVPTEDGTKHLLGGINWGGWSVAKTSNHKEEAFKLAKFLALDPEFHKVYGEADGLISNFSEPLHYEMSPLQEEISVIVDEADTITGHIDLPVGGKPAAGILDALGRAAQNIMVGNDVLPELEELDFYWDEHK